MPIRRADQMGAAAVDGFLEGVHAVLGQAEAMTKSSAVAIAHTDDGHAQQDERAIARQLAATLDRAMECEQWHFAERIATQIVERQNVVRGVPSPGSYQ